MLLLSPLPHGHLNHCQIQQTALWNSFTFLHILLLTGYIRGSCTKADVRKCSSSHNIALPQTSPSSMVAPAASPVQGKSTCPLAAPSGVWDPAAAAEFTEYSHLGLLLQPFLVNRAQHICSQMQEVPDSLCHRAHPKLHTTKAYPTSHAFKNTPLFPPGARTQPTIRKQFCMVSAAIPEAKAQPSQVLLSVRWDCSHSISYLRWIAWFQLSQSSANKRVIFLSFTHTKLLYCNTSDESNPY